MRSITADDIDDLAVGAAVLGTGGGGDPHIGKLMAKQAIERNGPVTLLDPDDLPDEALVIPSAAMGAPTVVVEKIPEGMENIRALRRLAEEFDDEVYATMPIECGGINSTIPFTVAAREGIPVVDGDGMGRAFPELHQETFNVYGVDGTPAVLADEQGDTVLFETVDNHHLEQFARAVTIKMGGQAYISDYPMSGVEVKETAIQNTVSLGLKIGSALRNPPADTDSVTALKQATADSNYGRAIELFHGKIVDVERRTEEGFAVGKVKISGLEENDTDQMTIDFQNENLVARLNGDVVASVPDLITLLEEETGRAITTESLRYGYRVRVIAIPTPKLMRTDAALTVWGPDYFGYDIEYVELEKRFPEYYRKYGVPPSKNSLI